MLKPYVKGLTGERYPHGREFGKMTIDGPACCKKCQAVHFNKRWTYDERVREEVSRQPGVSRVVCPGCHAIEVGRVDGVVSLKSPILSKKQDDVMNLLHHEEAAEKTKNPLSRIVRIEARDDEIEIQTTTQFLATRLGHAVERALQGDLQIDKLPRESFVRVRWSRAQ